MEAVIRRLWISIAARRLARAAVWATITFR
jgi:hypothetical protein